MCSRVMVWKLPVVVAKMSMSLNDGLEGPDLDFLHASLKCANGLTLLDQDAGLSTAQPTVQHLLTSP
jgi:hypothetical protein